VEPRNEEEEEEEITVLKIFISLLALTIYVYNGMYVITTLITQN
jgi:hypothetical protein